MRITQILDTDYTDLTRESGYQEIRGLAIRISGDPDHLVPDCLIAGYPNRCNQLFNQCNPNQILQ